MRNHTKTELESFRAGLPGKKFGKLTIIAQGGRRGRFMTWICRCDCGKIVTPQESNLLNGHTRSCGCINRLRASLGLGWKHGMIKSPTYYSWRAMRRRCEQPNTPGYHSYGGRGVRVCERWKNFELFLADMGERPPGTTIERKNTNGNYEPSNCRWATPLEQGSNRRNNRCVDLNGETVCVSEAARRLGTYPQKIFRLLGAIEKLRVALTANARAAIDV